MKNGYAICLNEWIFDKSIKNELQLLLYISSLTAESGYCYAGNDHLSKKFKTSKSRISEKIRKLKEKGYISIKYIYEKDKKEIKQRIITINNTYYQKTERVLSENVTGVTKIDKDNTTNINTTNINNNKDIFSDFNISENLKKAINEFFSYRQEIKKPYKSVKSKRMLIKRLLRYSDTTAIKMIAQSIENGWQGIFELKEVNPEQKKYKKL